MGNKREKSTDVGGGEGHGVRCLVEIGRTAGYEHREKGANPHPKGKKGVAITGKRERQQKKREK